MADFKLPGYGRQFLPKRDGKETLGPQGCDTARSANTPAPPPQHPIAAALGPPPKRSGHGPQPRMFPSQRSPAHLPTGGPAPAPSPSLARQAPERRCPPPVRDRCTSGTTSPSNPWGLASGAGLYQAANWEELWRSG